MTAGLRNCLSGCLSSGKQQNALFPMAYGLLAVVLLPYIHIGIVHLKFWVPDKPAVDKEKCSCSCFDTVFKGSYEKPGKTGYKHVYFNATGNTFKIWVITALFLLMLYESVKYLVSLQKVRQLHFGWLTLFIANIYPNYYSWWMFFGYYNDEFYPFLNHQIFFCITELCVSALVVSLCDLNAKSESWKLLTILSISLAHILVSGWDQFFTNIFRALGHSYQNSRDFGLMVPDVCHVVLAAFQYWRLHLSNDTHCLHGILRPEFGTFVVATLCLTFIPLFL